VRVCVCLCVCVYVRACVCACVRACLSLALYLSLCRVEPVDFKVNVEPVDFKVNLCVQFVTHSHFSCVTHLHVEFVMHLQVRSLSRSFALSRARALYVNVCVCVNYVEHLVFFSRFFVFPVALSLSLALFLSM